MASPTKIPSQTTPFMDDSSTISADFPFESKYVEVLGYRMHYIDEGGSTKLNAQSSRDNEDVVVIFLHGNPNWCYLWRNIIPYATKSGFRCIAPDLIGMGYSDKPNHLEYRFKDHYHFFMAFLEALTLHNSKTKIIFVIHDWGSALGFNYAMQHPQKVKGICFMEAIVRPMSWAARPWSFWIMMGAFRLPFVGEFFNGFLNMFINVVLKKKTLRQLTTDEQVQNAKPYPTYASRKALWMWPRELPLDGYPADTTALVQAYWEWLQRDSTPIPKLMITMTPGSAITLADAAEFEKKIPNLKSVHVGPGLHFTPEDHPHGIGQVLELWLPSL